MKPGINSDVGVKALEMLVKQKQYAPPNILQIGYPELNEAFLNGSTAMVVQWNDLALKVGDPKMSKVVGKGGYAACPVRTYMPYSRVMAVSAFSKNPEDAYKVAALHAASRCGRHLFLRSRTAAKTPIASRRLTPEAATKNHEGKPALDRPRRSPMSTRSARA